MFDLYFKKQWLDNVNIPIKCWSVFDRIYRSNNNVEGWHNKLNTRAYHQTGLNMYKLIQLLYDESVDTSLTVKFLEGGVLSSTRRPQYLNVDIAVNKAWQDFKDGNITVKKLLAISSKVCIHYKLDILNANIDIDSSEIDTTVYF